jgi:hypothetical protein
MVGAEQRNFENFESQASFVIIEIRTLDMVFKFKNFFDPQNGTLTEIFLATGGGEGEVTPKKIIKCPFFSKSASQSLAPPQLFEASYAPEFHP